MLQTRARGVFITGTDTGVGKTVYACRLLETLGRKGLRAVGMKPVASGAGLLDGNCRNADALAMMKAAPHPVPYERCNPYCFESAIAPHLAAQLEGAVIELSVILVVGIRLGCISHALLSADSIKGHQGQLLGWVANVIDRQMPCRAQTIAAIESRLSVPLLDVIEFTNPPLSEKSQQDVNISIL